MANTSKQRFYNERSGASWCVRDREVLITIGAMRGQSRIVDGVVARQKLMR